MRHRSLAASKVAHWQHQTLWALLVFVLPSLLTSAAPMSHCHLGRPAQGGHEEQHGRGHGGPRCVGGGPKNGWGGTQERVGGINEV